ncbi:nucleotidyltransferase family protein [Pseudaeromonas paramecii]|uniref:Nucleotidyltransferase family protein n=1 Tax=Pseudaeromonas paramecii TaxID=2138166 RepID=A0ABP8PW43_9GAMM
MPRLLALIAADPWRMACLAQLAELHLPDAWLAAGFVRNRVWDALHGDGRTTPLADVDLIYFDPSPGTVTAMLAQEQALQDSLCRSLPAVPWQVRNQARMHLRNGHAPYGDCLAALGHWPEQETAVAVRLDGQGQLAGISAFGLASLFAGRLTRNPCCPPALFARRLADKAWLRQWPGLRVCL